MYYLFLAALGFHYCLWAFSSCGHQGYFLVVVVSLAVERRLYAHRLSCPMSCRIFPDQGLNPCPLHWHADS